MTSFQYYISTMLMYLFLSLIFDAVGKKNIRNYFAIQFLVFTCFCILVCLIYDSPPSRAVGIWYELSLFALLDGFPSFYDTYYISSIIGLLYLLISIYKKSHKPYYISPKAKNSSYFLLFLLLFFDVVASFFVSNEFPKLSNESLYTVPQSILSAFIVPLAVIFFFESTERKTKANLILYLIFSCHWVVIYILVSGMLVKLISLAFFLCWYFFAYGKKVRELFSYLLLLLLVRIISFVILQTVT